MGTLGGSSKKNSPDKSRTSTGEKLSDLLFKSKRRKKNTNDELEQLEAFRKYLEEGRTVRHLLPNLSNQHKKRKRKIIRGKLERASGQWMISGHEIPDFVNVFPIGSGDFS